MKKILSCAVLVLALVGAVGFAIPTSKTSDYIRIHIKANSNESTDQNVKYAVRDAIIEYLTPLLAECDSYGQAKEVISKKLPQIESVATNILKSKSLTYSAKGALVREEFPARKYEDATLKAGIYDALIIDLGEASGDNWWCVAFPPLCFVPAGGVNVKYKSKIMEIINKYKDK